MANMSKYRYGRMIQNESKQVYEDAYEGNGSTGGGSVIVDALPAKGVEGTTYLLRKKTESEIFKAHAYAILYCDGEAEYSGVILVTDNQEFTKSVEKVLNPKLSDGNVNFETLENFTYCYNDEWEDFINNGDRKIIVHNEEEVLSITNEVGYIIQDLGEVGINNFKYFEFANKNSEQYVADINSILENLINQFVIENNEITFKQRYIEYNSELEPEQTMYSFSGWDDITSFNIVGTFTDNYEYNFDTLIALQEGDAYIITLTPEVSEVTYSYTEYVFDQGVYTTIGGNIYDLVVKTAITDMADIDEPVVLFGSLFDFWTKFMAFKKPVTLAILDEETYLGVQYNQWITSPVIRQNGYNEGAHGEDVIVVNYESALDAPEQLYIYPSVETPTSDADMVIGYTYEVHEEEGE